ncbi:MAG: hypothetical protein ACTHKJ_07520 [Candidatus Nitrosocosmicus sp.]
MSNKDNLKNKIKKPNATQAFLNSYDTDDIRNKIENKNTNMNYNDDIYIQNLIEGKKTDKKKVKKVFTSFYMDPDLAFEVNKIAARGKRGDKSKLINIAIRKLLEGYELNEKK